MDRNVGWNIHTSWVVLCVGLLAGGGDCEVPHNAMLGRVFEEGPNKCYDVPYAVPYKCQKEESIEESYSCPRTLERGSCKYEEMEDEETCHHTSVVTKTFPCLRNKKVKKCWKEPEVEVKLCKTPTVEQSSYDCEKVVVETQCTKNRFQQPSKCYRPSRQKTAYLCYRPQQKSVCKKPSAESCKKTKLVAESFPCTQTVYKTHCSPSTKKYLQGPSSSVSAYCPSIPVEQQTECRRSVPIEHVDEECMQTLQDVCGMETVFEPHTCEKVLPDLEEYECNLERTVEKCKEVEVTKRQKCYRDKKGEKEVNCSKVKWTDKCEEFELKQPGTCEEKFNVSQKTPCHKKVMREICRTERLQEQRQCYRLTEKQKTHNCYKTEDRKSVV